MNDNVHPIPARKPLPPEIAAIAIPQEGDVPQVYINEAEEPRTIIPLLRPDVYVPLFVGFVAERLSRLFREHAVAATAVVSVAGTVAVATGANMLLDRGSEPIAHPPVTVTVPASPPVTVTAAPSLEEPTPGPSSPEPTTESTRRPPLQSTPPETERPLSSPNPQEPQPRRTRRRPDPTPVPSAAATEPALREDKGAGDGPESVPSPRAGDTPSTPPSGKPDAPAPPAEPEPQPGLEPDGQARSCAIRVDADPLLDLCLLG